MTNNIESVANFFIEKSMNEGCRDLTPMKLLKLVYIAHGWSLSILGKPLINDQIQAWQHGPVIPNLYHVIKSYGQEPITSFILSPFSPVPGKVTDPDTLLLLEEVWRLYKPYSGYQLSTITHLPNTPWHEAWNSKGGARYIQIPDELIKSHYDNLLRQTAGAEAI